MRGNGWSQTAAYRGSRVVELAAADGHAEVELSFWPTEAAARRAVPTLAPAGVGWTGSVSWRSSLGFTLADEQTVDRCLAADDGSTS
jgi:hypothetical protein